MGRGPPARHRRAGRHAGGHRALRARRAQRAPPAHPRPVRQPHRRGRARPLLGLAAAAGGRARDPLAALARGACGRARGPRRADVPLEPGQRGRHVPRVDDLLGDPGAAPQRGARGRVGAAPDPPLARPGRPGRDGDDREAGRLGRPRQHHLRRARRRRPVRDHRPQVVLLLSAVRRLPDARPGPRRACPASCSRAATRASASSGSRTSWARARCPPPRSSSTG